MASRSLNVVITGDVKGFQAALASAARSTGTFASAQKTTAGKVTAAGKTMTKGITLPLVAAAAASVKFAANFEKQMSSLGAVTDASAADMNKLRKQALKAGADTKFSAQQAAEAQTALAKGGVSTAKILSGGLTAALSLAAAGELDLETAANTTANALNLFGLRADEAGHIADALATAANTTTADVDDFAMALTQAGSGAKLAGLSFDQTVLGLEALAKAGIKNSDAGTSMKTAIQQLLAPTAKQATLADKLNLSFVGANGKMRELGDISGQLRDKLGKMGDAQRAATLKTLAGSDGVRFLNALYAAGPKALDGYEKGLQKQGTAAEVAAKKQKNLAGQVEQLKGSLETLAIIVGSVLIPPLTAFAQKATKVANVIAEAFSGLPKPMKTLALAIVGVVAVLGPLLVIGGSIATAIAAISAPVLIVVAALAALTVGFITAYKHSQAFRDAVQAVAKWLRSNVPKAFAVVKAAAVAAFGWIATNGPKAFEAIKHAAQAVARTVGPVLGPAFDAVKQTIATIGPLVAALAARFMDLVHIAAPAVRALASVIGPVLGTALNVLLGIVTRVIPAVAQIFRGLVTAIRGVVQIITGILTLDLGRVWQGVKALFSGGVNIVLGILRAATAPIRAIVANIGSILTTGFRAALTLVKGIVQAGMRAALAALKVYTAPYRAAGKLLGEAIGAGVRAAIGAAKAAGSAIGAAIAIAVRAVVGAARAAGAAVANAIVAAIRALASAASAAGRAIAHAAVAAVRALIGGARTAGAELGRAVATGLRALIGNAVAAARAIGEAILAAFRAIVSSAAAIGAAIIQGLVGGIKSAAGAAAGAAADAAKGALNAAKNVIGIGSPSKEFHKLGVWSMEGYANGVAAGARMATASVRAAGEGVLFELENQIADARKASEALDDLFARTDQKRELDAARKRANRRIVDVPDDRKGSKDDAARRKIIERNKDIREARGELKKLREEADRAAQKAAIELKIEGLEKLKDFNDAIGDIRDSLDQMAETAAQSFRDMRQSAIDSELGNALDALDTSLAGQLRRQRHGITADPRVAELEAIRARLAGSEDAAQDAENAEKMANAKKKLANADEQARKAQAQLDKVAGSGSARLIDQAQRRVDLAHAAQAAATASVASVNADIQKLNDQRRADELEAEIENARTEATDRADAAKEGLDKEVADFQSATAVKLALEADALAQRKQNYATFAADVAAILAPLGLAFAPTPDQEQAILGMAAQQAAAAKAAAAKKKPPKKKHAAGGLVMSRLGEFARINELGPEDVWLPHGARVTQASQSVGAGRFDRGGPLIGAVTINEAGRLDEQAIAERLGFTLATRRR